MIFSDGLGQNCQLSSRTYTHLILSKTRRLRQDRIFPAYYIHSRAHLSKDLIDDVQTSGTTVQRELL